MKWYLIYSNADDYGACNFGLIKCSKKMLKHVYHSQKVEDEDVEVLKKLLLILLMKINQ